MIDEDVNHGSHGLFPCAAAAVRLLVILPFGGLFAPNFTLTGGVLEPHEVMLTQMEGIAPSAKPRVLFFREGSD